MNRVAAIALAAALLGFAGCSSVASLAGTSPQGVELAGTWRLNRAQSDDPSKLMRKMRDSRRREPPSDDLPGSDDGDVPVPNDRPRERGNDRRRGRGMGGDYLGEVGLGRGILRIEQSASEIVIDNGVRIRKLTPGSRSVVSAANGVADQSSGWKGSEFLVETGGRDRPTIVERYSVSADRRQLTVIVKINGRGELPNVEFKRVYDAAPDGAEESGPST
jgi:hypothetical protein